MRVTKSCAGQGMLLLLLTLILSGCGGGGSTSGTVANAPATTTLSGVAAKGIIKGGTISVYLVPPSGDITQKSRIVPDLTTDTVNGTFSVNIGTSTGLILLEASGDYIDESDGSKQTVTGLRSAFVIGNGGGVVPAAITPLTETAVQTALTTNGQIGTNLTQGAITAANTLVSDLFQFDILATQPVEPLNIAMNAATQAQRDYTLALAAIAKQSKTSTLGGVINGYRSDLSSIKRLSQASVDGFRKGLTDFLGDSTYNKTGISSVTSGLSQVGYYTTTLKLGATGQFATGTIIRGVQLTLNLPPGISIRADSGGIPLDGIITASGVAANGSYFIPAKYDATARTLSVALINSNGFGSGEFATIKLLTASNVVPTVSSFTVTNTKVVTQGGADITGMTTIYPTLSQ